MADAVNVSDGGSGEPPVIIAEYKPLDTPEKIDSEAKKEEVEQPQIPSKDEPTEKPIEPTPPGTNVNTAESDQVAPKTTEQAETAAVPIAAVKAELVVNESKDLEAGTVSENTVDFDTEDSELHNWIKREHELLQKIKELETLNKEKSDDGLKAALKVREEQIELLKIRLKNLETKLEAALSVSTGRNHEMIENIKQQHEELLSKARGMIFDKTKVVKNQELQIEALTTQVQSLKDVNIITKNLLDIRNSEVKAMEERLQVMETRFKTEKERYDLVLKRAQTSTNINDDLRKEYETQLAIFKELREKYEQRVQALVAENNRVKEAGGPSA